MVKFTIRQLEILKIISSCNEYITSKTITSDLDITRRTLINDIKHINQEKEIIISNNKGYLINDSFIEEIDDILADYQIEEENIDKIIKYIGLINSGMGKGIRIEDIYEEVGTPLDTYIGYEADSTLCVLSGLSLPYTKMDEIREKIDASKDTIKRNITAQNNSRLTNNLGFFDEVSEKPKEKKKSNRDMLF